MPLSSNGRFFKRILVLVFNRGTAVDLISWAFSLILAYCIAFVNSPSVSEGISNQSLLMYNLFLCSVFLLCFISRYDLEQRKFKISFSLVSTNLASIILTGLTVSAMGVEKWVAPLNLLYTSLILIGMLVLFLYLRKELIDLIEGLFELDNAFPLTTTLASFLLFALATYTCFSAYEASLPWPFEMSSKEYLASAFELNS